MVLLVTVFLSLSALSAADTDANDTVTDNIDQNVASDTQTKSVTNIESNSIENKVSNEYETTTNEESSLNDKTLTKSNKTSNDSSVKTATNTKSSITIKTDSITAQSYDTINIKANVTYTNGEKLNYAKVAIKINGITIIQSKLANGTIDEKYTLPLMSAKKYNLTIIVGETSSSLSCTKNTTLTVQRKNINIIMNDFKSSASSKVKLNATVMYDDGTLANGQKAVFKFNGKTIISTTVKNGTVSGTYILPASSGNYSILLKVGESTLSTFNSATSQIVVSQRTPTVEVDSLFFVRSGSTVTLKAKFSNTGYSDATGKVSFKVNGKTVGTVKIANNTASYTYKATNLNKGNYVVTIVYGGSSALKSVRLNSTLRVQSDLVSTYTYSQVLEKANSTHSFVLNNNRLPNYVTMNGNQVSMTDLLYMFAQALSYNNSYHNGGFSTPSTSTTTSSYNVDINRSDVISLAYKIVNSYIANGKAPSTIRTNNGVTLSFNDTIYVLAKTLSFTKNNNRLPNYVTVLKINSASSSSSSSSSKWNVDSVNYTSTNTVPSGYAKYLTSASNAYVNSTVIKNAVKTAVSGVTGTYNQAVAIFNFVRDEIDYSYYLNTRYGAIKTLTGGVGNCVDQSHLLLGMYRTAMIPARYCHATCTFRSGLVVGHVWVEVYVNGKWYTCDTTSNQNSFNKIVNWNSCTTIYRYTELYF